MFLKSTYCYWLLFLFFIGQIVYAQDPLRLQNEVVSLQKKYDTVWDSSKETIVFTGSSSIRFWSDLHEIFPDYQIVNTGFGGSQASDLLVYLQPLVLHFNPKKVFIYEGDNDVNDRKKISAIVRDTKKIVDAIKANNSATQIVIISAKPCVVRWHLRKKYVRLNRKFEKLCAKEINLEYLNIWDMMLVNGIVNDELFIEDGLHMNASGYQIWNTLVAKYIN